MLCESVSQSVSQSVRPLKHFRFERNFPVIYEIIDVLNFCSQFFWRHLKHKNVELWEDIVAMYRFVNWEVDVWCTKSKFHKSRKEFRIQDKIRS